ncbi:MAG: hypothetical protein IJC02_10300 [Lachnospiraceae bacterium]|nr:hypothetical protein [Lachnospiraceae bacterium]
MGIFIHLDISKSVTAEEWKKVYIESLKLVEAFPLADIDKMEYAGDTVTCIVPTREQESVSFFRGKSIGWAAAGDYETRKTAEEYFFPRDLIDETKIDESAGDAMMGEVSAYSSLNYDDPRCCKVYSLWDGKTQGEPYHMYLLAIACMVEDRLGNKAYVYGDITRGQCQKAVQMANQYLEKPIQIPARCDMNRLYERVDKLPLSKEEKLSVFKGCYLGKLNAEYGDYIRKHFDKNTIYSFWENRFRGYSIQMLGFQDVLKEYLSMAFDIEELCKLSTMQDKEGQPQYEEFVEMIMDSKMHVKEKNCDDYLEIDQDDEEAYSIWTLMAGFFFRGAKNQKVDRYVPIDEIRTALRNGLRDKCDVDAIMDAYLEREAAAGQISISDKEELPEEQLQEMCKIDSSEVFTQLMNKQCAKYMEERENYTISEWEDLVSYQYGDSVRPNIQRSLAKLYRFYNSVLEEKWYQELMEKTAKCRCTFLMQQNRKILIRDKDWRHIFSEIEKKPDNYARYYPMVRVNAGDSKVNHIVCGFILNDDLYKYAEELSRTIPDEEEERQEDE